MSGSNVEAGAEWVKTQKSEGRAVGLFMFRGKFHCGKEKTLQAAAKEGCALLVLTDSEDFTRPAFFVESRKSAYPHLVVTLSSNQLSECSLEQSPFQSDYRIVGEKDFPYILELRESGQKVETHPVFRDSDGIPWSSFSSDLSAEERFSALYIPRSLAKAKEMRAAGKVNIDNILEQTRENLEKAGDILVKRCEFLQSRLCLEVDLGGRIIRDNIELSAKHE